MLLPAVPSGWPSGCLSLHFSKAVIGNSGLLITAGKERRQPGAQVVCGATTSKLVTCVSSAVEPISSCDKIQGLGGFFERMKASAMCTSSTSEEMRAII